MKEESVTLEEVKSLLHYDPETGAFTWRVDRSIRVRAGCPAGSRQTNGYIYIGIKKKYFVAHRLAWFITHGRWPQKFIDHINCRRDDNRLTNLREATHSENERNCGVRSTNKLGCKGISIDGGRYRARIMVNHKSIRLGRYKTLEEAAEAYRAAASEHHGEFARIA